MNTCKTLSHILVKPSGPDCNMACSYCFYTGKASYFGTETKHRMSPEILEEMTKKSLRRPGHAMGFGWQGGEPTLMGLDFYRKAVELQTTYGVGMRISNSLQTNGLLIDDEWISFLKNENFLVGLSLDGPPHVHNRHRIAKKNECGTHQRVESAASALLAAGVQTNAVSVVTRYSSTHASETYRYFKSLGFGYLQFIPCLEMVPGHPGEIAEFSVTPAQYGAFLCELFDLWVDDFVDSRPTTSIRLFESFACNYLSRVPADCSARKTCGEYLVVEHDGRVFSCDFFVNDDWLLGQIQCDEPAQMLNSPRQKLFGEMKAKMHQKCRDCRWLRHCQGGCPKDRLRDKNGDSLSHFCESYTTFFRYADFRFQTLMERFVSRYLGQHA